MSYRPSFCAAVSTLFLVILFPVAASAQYSHDDVFVQLRRGFWYGNVEDIVTGMPLGAPVHLDFPEASVKRYVGRNTNATAILEQVFQTLKPRAFMPRPNWAEELEKSKEVVQCILKGRWRVEINGKSEMRELYITLRNDDDQWRIMRIRSAPSEP